MFVVRPSHVAFVRSLLPPSAPETDSTQLDLFSRVVVGHLLQMGAENKSERETAQRAVAKFGKAVVRALVTAVCRLEEFNFADLRGQGPMLIRINATQALILIAESEKNPDVLHALDGEIVASIAITKQLDDIDLKRQMARLIGFRPELYRFPEVTEFLESVRGSNDEDARGYASTSLGSLWKGFAARLGSTTEQPVQ